MRKNLSILTLLLCATACIYPYTPELDEAPEGVLAVDANISIGDVSTVRLSALRSIWPSEQHVYPDFHDAAVWVEDETGVSYPGTPTPQYFGYYDIYLPGVALFTIPTENAPADRRYRLCINALGAKYVSDWTDIAAPPVIREINFSADEERVSVNVSVDAGVEDFPDYSKYWCWNSSDNHQLFPVDYTAMSDSGITSWPIFRFSRKDNRNHKRYCVNIKARTLSKETYRFLKNLENNTTGGDNLFTPTPGEIAGNLRCESDPERTVLGYVLFSRTTSKRAWLDSRYLRTSRPHTLLYPTEEHFLEYYNNGYLPLEELLPELREEGKGPYGWGPRYCYDCTAAGGTQEKPDFWDDAE